MVSNNTCMSIGSLVVEGFWPQSTQVLTKTVVAENWAVEIELKQVINTVVLVLTGLCVLLICCKSSRRSQLC